jgi:hypothetical protein
MNLLHNLLKRFEHIKDPKEVKSRIAADISLTLNTTIKVEQIEFKNGEVSFLDIHPALRSTVFLNKDVVLQSLKNNCVDLKIYSIR